MPGPKSNPVANKKWNDERTAFTGRSVGKTELDRLTGKHARRLQNRRNDVIRNRGGKQFGKVK